MAAPAFKAAGPASSSDMLSNNTVVWPTHVAGDVALLFVETANETVTFVLDGGFVAVNNSPQGTGPASQISATRLSIFWRRATSAAEINPVILGIGLDHTHAQILTFSGVNPAGNPWDVTAGDVEATAVTAVSIPGATTVAGDDLVVAATSHRTDTAVAQCSGYTNANLTGLAELTDTSTDLGNGGGFCVAAGIMSSPGNYGATTATLATASQQGRISIALMPDNDGALGKTLDAATLSATGMVDVAGVTTKTLQDLMPFAPGGSGGVEVVGALSSQLDACTLSGQTGVETIGDLDIDLPDMTTALAGTVEVEASLSRTLDDLVLAGFEVLDVFGTLDQTLDPVFAIHSHQQPGPIYFAIDKRHLSITTARPSRALPVDRDVVGVVINIDKDDLA